MKKKLQQWWFKLVIHPYLKKHAAVCSSCLRDTIVYQMWYAGIGFPHINKWLVIMKEPTIKAYTMEGPKRDQVRLFYEMPDAARRQEISGRIISIV